jgi:hypothetical protein
MSNDTTTIEIDTELRDWLLEEREKPESSYSDTLWRLHDTATTEYVTAEEAREIARAEISDRVLAEAQS